HMYYTGLEYCAVPVGAGLPAIGPALPQQIHQTIALSRQKATEQLFQRLQPINPLFFLANFPQPQ
ncbi:hypothetical protein, partial [Pseudomonas sp.]|uniref:hypothetical protein n=1 Tax=Pseudomonas sp. TaxID=306 RepID=UPI003C790627